MRAPRWAFWLLEWAAGGDRADEVLGDLEEAHRQRLERRGPRSAWLGTTVEAVDMSVALVRDRWRGRHRPAGSMELEVARARRRTGVSVSWLDFKLGVRMLGRYPGVSVVGGLAMAIGVGLAAGYAEIARDFLRPALPLEEGHRIVGIQNWDVAERDPELRSLHDFVGWRQTVRTVEQLSAYRSIDRNLGPVSGTPTPATGAEITPSGFPVAGVPPLLGRVLVREDAREGAPPVVVLGYDLWRSRFAGDPRIVGQVVQLGSGVVTVAGVMPEGFAFPVDHDFWVPLGDDALTYGPREGPGVRIFGKLAPGATLAEAVAELAALGARAAADHPGTHAHLRPRVVPYPQLYVGSEGTGVAYGVQFLFVVLLLILASNVATMIFARTATREGEIAMRFALGASRSRILAQLFTEALVLALIAAAVGLGVVAWGSGWVTRLFWRVTQGQVPFWLDDRLEPATALYALGLCVLAALVAGVLPALRATRSDVRTRLRNAPGAVESGLRFGGLWGAVIAVQVALAVLVLPPAIVAIGALAEAERAEAGFPEAEYLSARIELDAERPPVDSAGRAAAFETFHARSEELRRRLLEESSVTAVTFATRLPGMNHSTPYVQMDSANGTGAGRPAWVMTTSVAPDFFEAFGARIVAGRGFEPGEVPATHPGGVVVNETFVREILHGRSAVGRRVRYAGGPTAPTFEILGVVSDLGMDTDRDAFHPGEGPGIYHPLTRAILLGDGGHAVRMALHVRGDAAGFAPRLREIARAVDPALRLYDVLPLDRPVDQANRNQRALARFATWGTAVLAVIAILISVAGIYSVLAFTVARQTREIGIRIALGAGRRRIVRGVFSRAILQIGTGIALGSAAWFYAMVYLLGGRDEIWLLTTSAILLVVVGLAACGVPVRRALRIEPTEALREVG